MIEVPLPPLVVDLGHAAFAWIQNGRGWLIDTEGARVWRPLTEACGIGGQVLTPAQIGELTLKFGRPQ